MAGSICESTRAYLEERRDLLMKIGEAAIGRYVDVLFEAWCDGRRVFVFGNGGSAYTASHHVCDYVKTVTADLKRPLQAFSLVDNVGIGTAVANDISYEDVFSFPLSAYAEAGDVAVAISCSGNSPNVLRACKWGKANGLTIVALTGFSGGKVKQLADVHVNIPHDNYGIVEDLHLSIGHIVSQTLRSRILAEAVAVRLT